MACHRTVRRSVGVVTMGALGGVNVGLNFRCYRGFNLSALARSSTMRSLTLNNVSRNICGCRLATTCTSVTGNNMCGGPSLCAGMLSRSNGILVSGSGPRDRAIVGSAATTLLAGTVRSIIAGNATASTRLGGVPTSNGSNAASSGHSF